MSVMSTWCSQLWTHLSSLSRRGRVVGLFLVAMVVAGGVLLLASAGGDGPVAVHAEPPPPEQLAAARSFLDDQGIDYQVESGRLLVAARDLQRVRAMLADGHVVGGDSASAFERAAGADSLLQTQAQSAKRWQAAKMAELSRLIRAFPAVSRATVILETGSGRKLGAPAVPPTAAVHVTMQDGASMTPTLARAIADLVVGSVAGMKAGDVRIVDSIGQSFRVFEDGPAPPGRSSAVPWRSPATRPVGVVPVAASAYPTTQAAGRGGRFPPASNRATPPDADRTAEPGKYVAAITISLAVVVLLGAAGAGWLVFRRRKRSGAQRAEADELAEAEQPPAEPPSGSPKSQPADELPTAGRFGFLRAVGPAELAGLLELEHPQTLAIILAHLPPESAGAVLAGLSEDKKVEVARRVVDLSQIDPAVVAEIEQALSSRLAEAGRRQEVCGGLTTIAKILQHAGYATERTVLEALEMQRPALAERIRRRLLVFEDLAKVPANHLRSALAGFGSQDLAVALRAAGRDLKRQILSCLPGSAARQVRREMDQMGPVRLSDVEAAQQRIVDAVRQAAEGAPVGAEVPQTGPYIA